MRHLLARRVQGADTGRQGKAHADNIAPSTHRRARQP
jgi:hypothetical protein